MKKSAFLIGLICLFFTSGFAQKAMPCFTRSGIYPMNIIKPDSSIRYMLLIKKL